MNETPLASSDWAGLVASMRFAPTDDLPRLVAADWLDDHASGRPELSAWGEFIRLQCEAAQAKRGHVYGDSCDCGGCRAERRYMMLFDRWRLHWDWHQFIHSPLAIDHNHRGRYDRGFLTTVSTGSLDGKPLQEIPGLVKPLFSRSPIREFIALFRPPGATAERYVLIVRVAGRPNQDELQMVKATLRRNGQDHPPACDEVRFAYPGNKFEPLVGAVVRGVLARRAELYATPEPAERRR